MFGFAFLVRRPEIPHRTSLAGVLSYGVLFATSRDCIEANISALSRHITAKVTYCKQSSVFCLRVQLWEHYCDVSFNKCTVATITTIIKVNQLSTYLYAIIVDLHTQDMTSCSEIA